MSGWDLVGKSTQDEKVEYLTLKEGTNTIRILDNDPVAKWTHWLTPIKTSINCIGKDCPICEKIRADKDAGIKNTDFSNRKVYGINVLDRTDNKVKVLEKGNKLFISLKTIMEAVGDLTKRDINLIVTNAGKTDISYTPLPSAEIPLTDSELKLPKTNLEEKYAETLDRDVVIRLMNGETFKEIFAKKEETVEEEAVEATEPVEALDVDFTKQ